MPSRQNLNPANSQAKREHVGQDDLWVRLQEIEREREVLVGVRVRVQALVGVLVWVCECKEMGIEGLGELAREGGKVAFMDSG